MCNQLGAILSEGTVRSGLGNITALLAPSPARLPDAKSAVSVVQALEVIFPQLHIDTKALEDKASELEKGVHKAVAEIEHQRLPMYA
jgi:predicted ATP-grasp superfamily ATP-dependent carboligase